MAYPVEKGPTRTQKSLNAELYDFMKISKLLFQSFQERYFTELCLCHDL